MTSARVEPRPELEAEDAFARLTADVTVSPMAVVLRYRFVPTTDATLLLFDGIPRAEERPWKLDLSLAYVSFQEPCTLVAKRVIPPAPTRCTVGFGVVPWLRVVRAGGALTGRIRLRFPVEEYSPYFPPRFRAQLEERHATRLRLELDYVPHADVFRTDPVPDLPEYHTFTRTGEQPEGVSLTSIGAECELGERVPVLKRVDRPFERV